MSFWKTLQKWWNPTFDWVEDPQVPLVLDFDAGRFCGVALGEPLERLRFLGNGRVDGCEYQFVEKGVVIGGYDRVIQEVILFFGHPDEPDRGYFRGMFQHRGERIESAALRTESLILERLGEPYWRDEDSGETILFYERRGFELQIELGLDSTLKSIVLSEPILADPAQREAYGVTKPWPPRN